MSNSLQIIKIILLIIILTIGGFFFSCTLPFGGDVNLRTGGKGLIVEDVEYEEEIPENYTTKINISLRNEGFNAENVIVVLSGLSDRWQPVPEITLKKPLVKENSIENFVFEVKSPSVETNTTYSFNLAVEYNYTSKYILFIRLEKKDDNNIIAKIEEEKMLKPAPISIKLLSSIDGKVKNSISLNFSIKNIGGGKILNNESVRIKTHRIFCKSNETRLAKESGILECSLSIPDFSRSLTVEIQIEAYYRYFYQLEKPYKIKVYDVK